MPSVNKAHLSPSRVILLSMAAAIVIGTFLLTLPIARLKPLPLIDILFTATSATCVTGLLTIPLDSFTDFGHFIIMILLQIGGLGLVTLTLCIVSFFLNVGLTTKALASEVLELNTWKNTKKILLFIFGLTLFFETIGSIAIFMTFRHEFPFWKAVFYSCFHSVSAFCNAGVTLFDGGMVTFNQNPNMLITTGVLMFAGGLGFIAWREFLQKLNPFTKRHQNISLQTRIIVSYFFILLFANAAIFFLLEHNNTFDFMSEPIKILNAFFTAIATRSGGYTSVYANDMQPATLFSIMLNSFIGSAPGSTGSGIKITTAAIFLATINAAVQNDTSVTLYGRRIIIEQVYRALAIVALSLMWIIGVTFFLLLTERSWQFIDIFFEAFSAFSTLGISIGITPYLSIFGKFLIIVTMFVGRTGYLTLMIALRNKMQATKLSYPEERVMMG